MKRILFFLTLLLVFSSVEAQTIANRKQQKATPSALSYTTGAFIDVNASGYVQTDYPIGQLVNEVLISGGASGCATSTASNVIVSPFYPDNATQDQITQYNQNRPWGYFHKGTTDFPFESGIVLVTGKASDAGNAFINNTLSSMNGGGSDSDLINAIGTTNPLSDAVFVEFDFVPTSTQVTFRYIFASEEYSGTFPCTFDDAFALLLKKEGDANYQNLAVLPDGAGPVAVTNIHGLITSCPAINEQYFAGQNTNNIETNFNGRTVPLTAIANVEPGQTYHFKMVIADARDSSYNSAVFLEAGSFDIGLQIVDTEGVALPPEVTICENYSIEMVSSVQIDGATYQWFLNGNPISGATAVSYEVNQAGIYSLEITVPGSQCPVSSMVQVNQIPQPPNVLPEVSGVICEGDFLVLDAGLPVNNQNFTYQWSTQETTQTIIANQPGVYSVNIDNGTCVETYSTIVEKAEIPVIKDVQFDNHILTITAENLGAGVLEYSIDGGTVWQSSNVFTDVESNIDIAISVRVKTTTCKTDLRFYTFEMQNVITPNSDDKNDDISFDKISRYNNFSAIIFDRYGKVIYKFSDNNRAWDGRFSGKLLSTDTYWYKLNYENPASKKMEVETGFILLKNRKFN